MNSVVSATVLSENCITSDAIATMLMVLPYDKGLDIVNGMDNVECMILINKDDDILKLESFNFKDRVVD
jgi:thiamine biosynthesis lipoprotein